MHQMQPQNADAAVAHLTAVTPVSQISIVRLCFATKLHVVVVKEKKINNNILHRGC